MGTAKSPQSQDYEMILNSFSEVNTSVCPTAFQDLNGLGLDVGNEEEAGTSGGGQGNSFPPLPMPIEPDYVQGEEILMKALQSPFPTLNRAASEQVNQNDVLRYLNIAPGESDVETFSKFSADSVSSREQSLGPVAVGSYPERKMLSISDVCTQGGIGLGGEAIVGVGSKRKATAGSSGSSKRCKVTQTSKFCHICVRSGEQVTLVPCANVVGSVCRKAVCQKCFDKHGFAHEWANACKNREIIRQMHCGQLDRLPENVWTCLHCRQICPATAQCKIYARTNRRRHLILKQRKAEKDRMIARSGLTPKDFRAQKRNAAAAAAAAVNTGGMVNGHGSGGGVGVVGGSESGSGSGSAGMGMGAGVDGGSGAGGEAIGGIRGAEIGGVNGMGALGGLGGIGDLVGDQGLDGVLGLGGRRLIGDGGLLVGEADNELIHRNGAVVGGGADLTAALPSFPNLSRQ